MNNKLKIVSVEKGYYKLYYYNDKYMGDLLCGDDGYYAWWPEWDNSACGYISELDLLAIYNILKELNAEWDKIIQSDPNI